MQNLRSKTVSEAAGVWFVPCFPTLLTVIHDYLVPSLGVQGGARLE